MNPAHTKWALADSGMTAKDRGRFYANIGVEDDNGCWPWLGTVSNSYGQFFVKGRKPVAHRVSYELFVGPIPAVLDLDHLCRVRTCVNPSHLEPVTTYENQRRGIGFIAENIVKDHCINGHEFSSENTRQVNYGKGPERQCKQCRKEGALRTYYRNRDHILADRAARRARGLAN